MGDSHRLTPQRLLLAVVIGAAAAVVFATTQLEVGPHRVTPGTAVVALALLVGALALPALVFARWAGATE